MQSRSTSVSRRAQVVQSDFSMGSVSVYTPHHRVPLVSLEMVLRGSRIDLTEGGGRVEWVGRRVEGGNMGVRTKSTARREQGASFAVLAT